MGLGLPLPLPLSLSKNSWLIYNCTAFFSKISMIHYLLNISKLIWIPDLFIVFYKGKIIALLDIIITCLSVRMSSYYSLSKPKQTDRGAFDMVIT